MNARSSLAACTVSFSFLFAVPGNADTANDMPVGTIEGRIVEGSSLQPVEGATVVVTDAERGPVVATGTTDPDGRFRYKVPPGTYDILGIFGESRWIHLKTKVERGKIAQVPGALSLEAEMVTVHEKAPKPEHRPPEPVHSTVKPVLPYSDEAIDKNAWVVGWMLLDVDEKGVVTGFRFLHKPGYGLDSIAEKEIWGLRFKPAVDVGGQPMVSKVLWKLEWPAFHYAKQHGLFGLGGQGALTPSMEAAARLDDQLSNSPSGADNMAAEAAATGVPISGQGGPPGSGPLPSLGGASVPASSAGLAAIRGGLGNGQFLLPDGQHKPPCKGSGPMNLDDHEPLYRDCTPPNLGNVNSEPLIKRPAN